MAFTDEELMMMVKKGNLTVMRELFLRYHVRIFVFINRKVQDRELSSDLTQDVFYKALKYRSSYSNSSFSAWLHTIAKNIYKDHIKSKQRQEKVTLAFHQGQDLDEVPQSQIERRTKALFAALDDLSEKDRELIELCKFQGLQYKEIARIRNTSEGAIKTKVHRIMEKLRLHFYRKNQVNE